MAMMLMLSTCCRHRLFRRHIQPPSEADLRGGAPLGRLHAYGDPHSAISGSTNHSGSLAGSISEVIKRG